MTQQDGPAEVDHTHECSECGCPFACTCPAPFGDPDEPNEEWFCPDCESFREEGHRG